MKNMAAGKKRVKAPHSTRLVIGIAIGIACVALLASIVIWQFILPRGVSLGFFPVGSSEEKTLRAVLDDKAGVASIRSLPAASSLAGREFPDAIIGRLGAVFGTEPELLAPIPQEFMQRVPPSSRSAIANANGQSLALPLLLDQFQVSYSSAKFAKAKVTIKDHLTSNELRNALAANKDPNTPTLLFAGGDDETLLLVLSVLCESRGGLDAYHKLASLIAKQPDFNRLTAINVGSTPQGEPFDLNVLIQELREWRIKGYLPVEWSHMQPSDVRSFMENGLAYVVLAPLSFRRTVSYEIINDYGWASYPELPDMRQRGFVAPMTGIAFSTRGMGSQTEAARSRLLERLTDREAAWQLATGTGMASTLGAAQAPDIQASDALAWAAASTQVVNGLFRDAFTDETSAHAFAELVRNAVSK